MAIRPGTSWALLLAFSYASGALGACAKSDPIGGAGGSGSGGWERPEDTSATEAGPEVGSGAGTANGNGGADGDPPSSTGTTSQGGGSTGSGELCGDGTCQVDLESCETCPGDCGGPCAESCGDGACDAPAETCDTCSIDCGACGACDDGICDEPAEDCESCASDCGVCMCEPDDLEPNSGSGTASPIALNVEVSDLSICAADVDWFEFSLNGTRTVTISFSHASGDLELEIYSEQTGQYVTGSYSENDDEQVVLTGQPAGTYWARVYGAAAATNWSYAIVVED